MRPSGPSRRLWRRRRDVGARLEPETRQAVWRFVRVLGRIGCSPRAIEAEVARACAQMPGAWSEIREPQDTEDPGHVLTLWFSDPNYMDRHGSPRSLPLKGAAPSLESLAHRVDPNLDVRAVVRYLTRGGGLKRLGKRYVPRDRILIFKQATHRMPVLGGLFGLLRTLELNQSGGRAGPRRLQLFAFNPRLPVSAVPGVEKRLRRLASRLVIKTDADMHRKERTRRRGERTVRIGVGVYQYVEDRPRSPRVRKRSRRRNPR